MKISTFLMMLVIVGVVLFAMISMVYEGEEKYSTDVNTTNWEEQYDFVEEINDEVAPIQESLLTLGDKDQGFLGKIGAGFTGIIAAMTFLPSMVINTGILGTRLITGLGASFGLPPYIIYALIISLTIWGMFKLIEAFQRWNL